MLEGPFSTCISTSRRHHCRSGAASTQLSMIASICCAANCRARCAWLHASCSPPPCCHQLAGPTGRAGLRLRQPCMTPARGCCRRAQLALELPYVNMSKISALYCANPWLHFHFETKFARVVLAYRRDRCSGACSPHNPRFDFTTNVCGMPRAGRCKQ